MTLATIGSTLAWAGMHRQHHKYSDKSLDPHSPVDTQTPIKSFFMSYIGLWKIYVARPEFTGDLRRDDLHKFLHRYYFLIIMLWCLLLAMINPLLVLFMYTVPAVFCFHAASLIVTAGHTSGTRDYKTSDNSRNNILLHWVTWGEGLHNLHHAQPKHFRYREGPAQKWYYFDLPGFIIENFLMVKLPNASKSLPASDVILAGKKTI